MMRRMLVPLDGSALAESILPCVRQFARLTGASITLFHVIAPPEERRPGSSPGLEADHQAVATYLAEVAADCRVDDIETEIRIARGSPAAEIIAAAHPFDLIAMATHGRGGFGRLLFGSVADVVLRGATVPVLLVRARDDGHVSAGYPRRILVPLDGSELAEHALPLATALARLTDAELILTQSITWLGELSAGTPYVGAIGSASLLETEETNAADYLQQTAVRLQRQGLRVGTDLRFDTAAGGILTSAVEQQADLIVMCTHGRGGLGRLVFGSVAADVLHDASVPVLLVRANVPIRVAAATPAGAPA